MRTQTSFKPEDLLTIEQFSAEYQIPTNTVKYWRHIDQHGFRGCCLRMGKRVFVVRGLYEELLQKRIGS